MKSSKRRSSADDESGKAVPLVDDNESEIDDSSIPHERKPSPLGTWMRGLREKSKNLKLPNFRGPKIRNAAIAGLVALVAVFFWMKHLDSNPSPNPDAAAEAAQPTEMASETNGARHPPSPPEASAPGSSGKTVHSLIQQFERSFAKTQDQR